MGMVITYRWTWLAFSACFYVSSSCFGNRVPLGSLCSAGSTGENRGAPAGLAVTAYDLRTMYLFLFFFFKPLCYDTLSHSRSICCECTLGRGLLERRKQALTSRRLWLADKVICTASRQRCRRQMVESKPVEML